MTKNCRDSMRTPTSALPDGILETESYDATMAGKAEDQPSSRGRPSSSPTEIPLAPSVPPSDDLGGIESADDASRVPAAHRRERESNGIVYRMSPGRTEMTSMGRHGPQTVTLAHFSVFIESETEEIGAPGGGSSHKFQLSVIVAGSETPRSVSIPAERFASMQWPELCLGAAAVVSAGRPTRDHLRVAIQLLSRPSRRRLYLFTGWADVGTRPVYVTSDASIDADGVVRDLSASPTAPADRIALPPPPSGTDRDAAVRVLVQLFDVEPAEVMLPAFGLAIRAVMGPSRACVHIAGRKGLGKTLISGLVASLFGKSLFEAPLCSWADGSSANGISRTLATVGDAVVVVDDLRVGVGREEQCFALFDRVVRGHHNRSAPRKLTREGGSRNDPPTRASILSTGEVLPLGHSTRDRVVSIVLHSRPAPSREHYDRARALEESGKHAEARRESSLDALMTAASSGVLAAGMSAFVEWYAPHHGSNRDRLDALERDAARRWELGEGDRASGLLGALALGLETLFDFLEQSGVLAPEDLEVRRLRARSSLQSVAKAHGDHVADEDPAERFIALIREALASGRGHLLGLRAPPQGGTCEPTSPRSFGWRVERQALVPRGNCFGYLDRSETDVALLPGPAFTLALNLAREEGRPLSVDKDGLGDALRATGRLSRVPPSGRRGHAVKVRVCGAEHLVWMISLRTLHIDLHEVGVHDDPEATVEGDDDSDDDGSALATSR